MIGIIIPPIEIKKMVDRTAQHVAHNGSEFEKMILERQQGNIQFAFLDMSNPYRRYYDHMVGEFSRKIMQGEIDSVPKEQDPKKETIEEKKVDQQEAIRQKIFQELKEPDPERFIAELPEKLMEAEQAIIQNTAQFVAKSGRNFLIALSERQKNNPQFEFLKSSSKNYKYFLALSDAYKNILALSEADISLLQSYAQSKDAIFKKCQGAYEYYYAKKQHSKGRKDQNNKRKENAINWNDFQLVQTIAFEPETTRRPIQKSISTLPVYNFKMQEKIISEPKKREILQQCHACKQNILASEMSKHLKTCLSLRDKKKPIISKQENSGDVDIGKNLDDFSSKRPDIFGDNRIKNQEDEKKQPETKVIWHGQDENMTKTTASVAMVNNQNKKLKEKLKEK